MNILSRLLVPTARWLNRASMIACGLLMLALAIVVLLQVLFRYVLELPLTWSDEAARGLLVWLSFIGGGIAIAEGLHPRVELIDSVRSIRGRRAIEVLVAVLIMLFLGGLFLISLDVAVTYNAYRSLALRLPQSVPRLALPVGALLMAINVLSKMLAKDETPTISGIPNT